MKWPTICCCFTWIVFIEFDFTVPILLIRKTWDGQLTSKVAGDGKFSEFRGGWDPSNGKVDTPLRTMYSRVSR